MGKRFQVSLYLITLLICLAPPTTASANQPPVLSPIGNRAVKEGSLLKIKATATDPDGDTLTYSYSLGSSMPPSSYVARFNASKGRLVLNPSALVYKNVTIADAITITVSDGNGGEDSETIGLTIINEASPLVGYFSPAIGSAINSTDEISVIVNSAGISQVGMYYRRMRQDEQLKPLELVNDPVNNPEFSSAPYQKGYICRFKFPAGEPPTSGEYDFELWVKDTKGRGWWSGWGGSWVLYSLTVNPTYTGKVIMPHTGGEVVSSDGKARLVIPPHILSRPAYIGLDTVPVATLQSIAPADTSLLIAVDCQPIGLFFTGAADLYLTLDKAEVPGTLMRLGLYDSSANGIINTGLGAPVGPDGYTVNFQITHFSTYAALQNLVSSGSPIGASTLVPLPDMLTGAFSHSIPITIPPGRKGVQPNLAIQYRSSNRNSWLGYGWTLNPGFIVRSTKTGPPSYDDKKDTFILATDSFYTELVHLIDNVYQARIESAFAKFYKEPDDSWRVVNKDGSVMIFGTTQDSREAGGGGTFTWNIKKVIDTNGNYTEFFYEKPRTKSYLSRIEYTGNENVSTPPTHTVEFIRESRSDIRSSYLSGANITTDERLKAIEARVSGGLVWRYNLEYTYSSDTGRSLLKSVTQSGSDGTSLPVQAFTYQNAKGN